LFTIGAVGNVALRSAPPWVGVYWLMAGTVLLAEYLFISFIFDAGAWIRVPGPLRVLGHLGELATMATVAVFGTFLLRGSVILEELRAQYQPQPITRRALWAVLHLLSYPLLVYTTSRIFAVPDPTRVTVLGFALWLFSAGVSVATLLLVLMPWHSLRALVPRIAPAIGIGLLAGGTAFGFGQLSSMLWGPMGRLTLVSVHALLVRAASNVFVDYDTFRIGTNTFLVEVAPVCSGFEGIGLIVVFLGGYIALNRKDLRFPNALWLLPLAVVTVWAANVVRIVALILIGANGSPQVALGGFHSKAGWVLFSLISLGFCALLRNADVFRAQAKSQAQAETDEARAIAAAYLLPQLALLATVLVTGLFVHVIDYFYGVRIAAALGALWLMRARLRPLLVRPGWQSAAIGVLVFALWYALTDHHTAAGEQTRAAVMSLGQPGSALWIALRVIGSVLIVPITEELAFRGYLLRRVIDVDFDAVSFRTMTWRALLVSSLAFGLLHGDWIAATLAGAAYGIAQWRSGRLVDAVVAHAVTNALVALDVLVMGSWAQW
jgi:exosortase E/protease (VPEID-CTERM system)